MPKPDRSDFARRNAGWLTLFFLGCLAIGGVQGNVFAGLAGFSGIVWVVWAHLQRR